MLQHRAGAKLHPAPWGDSEGFYLPGRQHRVCGAQGGPWNAWEFEECQPLLQWALVQAPASSPSQSQAKQARPVELSAAVSTKVPAGDSTEDLQEGLNLPSDSQKHLGVLGSHV